MNNKQTPIEKAIDLIDGFLTQLDDIAESKNKQSMKLYTEEQVRQIFENLSTANGYDYNMETYCDSLTPIELPSDEEIDAHVEEDFLNATGVHKYSEQVQILMKEMCKAGMKCMRDNIMK